MSIPLQPLFERGLDMQTAPDVLKSDRCARSEGMRSNDGRWRRRDGFKRLAVLTDVTATAGALTYGTAGKYAKITAAAQYLLPVGGFGFGLHFNAVRPAAGKTAHLLASRVNGKAYGPFTARLDDAGVFTMGFRKESDESAVDLTTVLVAAAETHALLTYDPYTSGGKVSLHVNGAEADSETGVGASVQPMQDGPDLYLANEFNPATPGITADTFFAGALDTFVLLRFNGRAIRDENLGGTTLLDALVKWSLQDWPNPESSMVVGQWPADAISGTQLTDVSRHQNHGVLTGAPAAAAGVALRVVNGQLATTLEKTSGERLNVVVAGGALYTDTVRGAY